MSAGRSACLCWTLLSVCLLASSSAGQTNIKAEPGQTVSLPCKALNNDNVIAVEWRRTDMMEEEYVLLYRNKMFVNDSQRPSYKNRVDLQDREMKDGNVSLILNNVTTGDNGTYECYVGQNKTNQKRSIIILEVVPPGCKAANKNGTKRRKRSVLDSDPICPDRLDVVPPGHTDERKEDGGDKERGDKNGSVGLIVGLIVPGVLLLVLLVF